MSVNEAELEIGDTVRVVYPGIVGSEYSGSSLLRDLERCAEEDGVVQQILADGDIIIRFDFGRRRFPKQNVELVGKKKAEYGVTAEEKIEWLIGQVLSLTAEVKSLRSTVNRMDWSERY